MFASKIELSIESMTSVSAKKTIILFYQLGTSFEMYFKFYKEQLNGV